MTRPLISASVVLLLSIICSACGSNDFNEDRGRGLVEAKPVRLDGEQASLTPTQVDCGVKSELWEAPTETSPGHSSAHLMQPGRDLKFSDDVLVDPAFRQPYVQLKGDVQLVVLSYVGAKAAGENSKIGEFTVGAKIPHACFSSPVPLLGVKKGNFREDVPVAFRFNLTEDGWHMDQLLHQ
jgi:hypothetical protein